MQELRLVGVHDDGEHLLLSGEGGETYRLRIDEALRTASSRQPRRAPLSTPSQGGGGLSPREIQARIRAGATAEEVAAEAGLELAHVERYDGPVRAEREYIAQLARKVEVAAPLPSHDGYRSAFGDNPASLGEMVTYRLHAYGVEPASVEWDSWRRPDGSWDVVARFELNPHSQVSVGEEPPARWIYHPGRKSISNANRWAQLLSELEPLDGVLPARRLSAVADRVFDIEAENGPEEPAPAASDNLLDVLRARRGQRLGVDEEGDDALALMLSQGSIPAAHPREGFGELDDDGQEPLFSGLSLAPSLHDFGGEDDNASDNASDNEPHDEDHDADGLPRLHQGVSPETREITVIVRQQDKPEPAGEPSEAETRHERRPIKPRRSSVPSWDDIVFGTKGD